MLRLPTEALNTAHASYLDLHEGFGGNMASPQVVFLSTSHLYLQTQRCMYIIVYIYVTSKNQSSLFGGMETELRQCIETSWSFTLQGVILVQHNSNFVPWKSTFCQRCLCTNLISSQKRFLLKCLSVSSIGRHGGAFKWETPIYKSPYLYTILQTYLLQTSL